MIKYPLSVTIDTNIFDECKYDFDTNSTLTHLKNYVDKGKIKLYISNIVAGEMSRHIKNRAYNIATAVNNTRKVLRKNESDNLLEKVGMELFLKKVNREELAKKAADSLDNFLKGLNIEYLDSEGVDIEGIFNDYFNYQAPFEDNDKKRKEFPDAFIAAQIKLRFDKDEELAIISKDVGFKNACGNNPKYMFFNSLGDLYDRLSKEEKDYDESRKYIYKSSEAICDKITEIIKDNDCVEVIGVSVDNDGIEYGYDYDEYYVNKVNNLSFRIRSIDEIEEGHIYATLLCSADISVDCFYDDYDNAIWDHETGSYLFLQNKHNLEKHKPKFKAVLDFDKNSNLIKVTAMKVVLGGDSRKTVECCDDSYDADLYYLDMDRKSAGLRGLSEYETYLKEDFFNSDMQRELSSDFDEINYIMRKFEDICYTYDGIIDLLNDLDYDVRKVINHLKNNKKSLTDILFDFDIETITQENIDLLIEWIESKRHEIERFEDFDELPDGIGFGDEIILPDANNDSYTLLIDTLDLDLSEGESETINLCLFDDAKSEEYKGRITLTVGYINYNEDGGVEDGLEDSIEYSCEEIMNKIKMCKSDLEELLSNHLKLNDCLDELL